MKSFLKWLWVFLEVIIIFYVIVMTSFILSKNKYGFTQFGDYVFSTVSLMDERNNEKLSKGDLLIVKNTNDINKGDLIYYYAVYNDQYIINSDYVRETKKDDYSSLYTLKDEDGTYNISSTRVLGKYATVYPMFGSILDVIQSRIGFLFLVLLPIMIVFIYQVYDFFLILRYERGEKPDKKSKKKEDSEEEIEVL